MGENLQTSLFLWVTFFCDYRNRELPSSSHLWDTQAFFSQESPVKARNNTVFTVFRCRSGRLMFLWDSWVLSALILLWVGRFTYIASDFRYGSFKMVVSSVFGYQVFRSIKLKITLAWTFCQNCAHHWTCFSVFYEPRKVLTLERERELEYHPGILVVASVQ